MIQLLSKPRRVTLIRPPAVETIRFATTSITPPLGLAYIAGTILKSGRSVDVLDAVTLAPTTLRSYFKGYLIGLDINELVDRISPSTDFIGITAIFTHEWPMITELIRLIRQKFPKISIIVGGEHVTSMPSFCAATSEAQYFVCGEGEETILHLLDALESNDADLDTRLSAINGLVFKSENRQLVVNPRRSRNTKLDDIAPPAWQFFDLKTYHEQGFVGGMYSEKITVPILATRGCPYQCTYCSSPNMWSPLWLPRDPIKVVDEIESYVKDLGAGNFPFQDLTAIINKDWIIRFAAEVIRRNLNISWQLPSGTRSEVIDDEVADWLAKSGMKAMAYAPEAGSEKTRKLIHKRVRSDRMIESVLSAKKSDLSLTAFFVIGFPHDTHRDMLDGLPFIRDLAKAGMNDISVGYYMALPGTQLFHQLYRKGELIFNREYFSHILDSQSFIPRRSFSPHLTRMHLVFWKFFLFSWFYSHRIWYSCRRTPAVFARQFLSSLFGLAMQRSHQSRLQTVAKNFGSHLRNAWKLRKQAAWPDELRSATFFEKWDQHYRHCLTAQAAASAEYVDDGDGFDNLKQNYFAGLRRSHRTPWKMPLSN